MNATFFADANPSPAGSAWDTSAGQLRTVTDQSAEMRRIVGVLSSFIGPKPGGDCFDVKGRGGNLPNQVKRVTV